MSHNNFQSESERLKGTARGERHRGCRPLHSVPDTRREQREKAESDPRGTSLGEVLSCRRIFDLGKMAQKREILVNSMSSTAGAPRLGLASRRADRCRFGESLQGGRKAFKLGQTNANLTVGGMS
jgi:hypothetical protein